MILTGDALEEAANNVLAPSPAPSDFGPVSVDVYAAIEEPRIVESGEHLVVPCAQDVDMPNDLCAFVTGRSTHMRDGMFMPCGVVDPGFRSDRRAGAPFKLEFGNTSDGAGLIEPGEPAARLTFIELRGETDGYDGRWGMDR